MVVASQSERFEEVQQDWADILPRCVTNTVFVTPWWQKTWWRHFGRGSQLRFITLRNERTLLGIAPLVQIDGVISFLGGSDLFDYHDFLVVAGDERLFYDAIMDSLLALEWDTLDLSSLPQGSPTLRHIPAIAERRGIRCEVQEEGKAPVLRLPSTWDEYLALLSRKARHELRRKLRRIQSAGTVRQFTCEGSADFGVCMRDFFHLHRISRPDKAEFMTPERESFFLDAAAELRAKDRLKLAFLELDGVRVACCLSFEYLDSILLYNSGYDPGYSNLSVGLVSKALAVKDAIQAGMSSFDFLRGTERYKYDLGAKDRSVYRLILHR